MAQPELTPQLALLEEAMTVLFCQIDDAYYRLNPKGRHYETLKELSDSEIIALALFQQLRGIESERSFLREAARFFSHLFPGVVGFHPSSFHRRVRRLRRFLEPLRRAILEKLIGDPETLLIRLHAFGVTSPAPSGAVGGLRWSFLGALGEFQRLRGMKLHLLCAANRVPICYELTSAEVADIRLTEELLCESGLGEEVARRLLGDLAYQSEDLKEKLAEVGILLATEKAEKRSAVRQQIEIALSSLKRVFGLRETLATTLVGLATRIAAKITAYTYAFYVNRMLGRPQGKIKEVWA
jgi:hypothetical protein